MNGYGNTPDYLNSCGTVLPDWSFIDYPPFGVPKNYVGYQNAKEGNGYAHIIVYNIANLNKPREFLICKLSSPLKLRRKYVVSFWSSPADTRQYAVNRLGVHLSLTPPVYSSTNGLFDYIPQIVNNGFLNPLGDTSVWTLIKDTFQSPEGGEQYLTIGNFFKDIDSDTFSIGDGINYVSMASYFIDDVSVVEIDTTIGINENEFSYFQIFPNPAQNTISIKNRTTALVSIYSLSGALLLSESIKQEEEFDISHLPNGIYVVAVGNRRERLVVCR